MIRKFATPLFAAFITALLTAGACHATDAYVAEKNHKITVGTGVRVRAAPSTSATEVGKLTLGTDFASSQRTAESVKIGNQSAYWYQVDAPLKGWIFGGFLRSFDPAQADNARLTLIRDKIGAADKLYDGYDNKSPLSFSDAVETSQFAHTAAAASKDAEARGELELAYWRAVQLSLFPITSADSAKPPYAAWLKQLGDNAFHSEPSDSYLVKPENFWTLADLHAKDAIGDAIAWQAANAFVGGECEGSIGCMSARSLMMEGEYLKRFPHGKHAEDALKAAAATLDFIKQDWKNQPDEGKDVDLKAWQAILAPLTDSAATKAARKTLQDIQALNH
jgi:hypothetical protein